MEMEGKACLGRRAEEGHRDLGLDSCQTAGEAFPEDLGPCVRCKLGELPEVHDGATYQESQEEVGESRCRDAAGSVAGGLRRSMMRRWNQSQTVSSRDLFADSSQPHCGCDFDRCCGLCARTWNRV